MTYRSGFLKTAGLLSFLFGGMMAHAGTIYFVQTTADSTVGDEGAKMSYDSRFGSTLTEGGNPGFSYTSGGTANTPGLTSSFDQTSAMAPGGLQPFRIVTASAYAAADLASGSVRISGNGNLTISNNGAYGPGEASGDAELADQLTFHIAGATPQTITPIMVTYSLDGESSVLSQSIRQETFTGSLGIVSSLSFGGTADFNYTTTNNPPLSTYVAGWASDNFSATPDLFTFQGVFDLQGATYALPVNLSLNYYCQAATCDYSHTGVLNLSVPSNVTYASDSGVFLTQPLTETPEPA